MGATQLQNNYFNTTRCPSLNSICIIYIRCCNQRHNKFFLPKGKLQVAVSVNYRGVRWILGFAWCISSQWVTAKIRLNGLDQI
jgi:hypothetical protein